MPVELLVDPPSEILVDGRSLGKVQVTRVELTPGRHSITQRISGYRELVHEIEVTTVNQRITLRLPPFGMLTVIHDLDVPFRGARVLLDGKDLGGLPIHERKVEAGQHEVQVTWPDGGAFSERVTIGAAAAVRLTVRPQ